MHTLTAVHVAIGIAALSVVLSTFALCSSQDAAPATAAAPVSSPQEAQALRVELLRLRTELEGLRRSLPSPNQRTVLLPVEDREEEDEEPVAVPSDGSPSAQEDLPHAFSLREGLLEDFHSLSGDDRADALRELGELARWGDAEARALLVESLLDADARVRRQAVRELTELTDPALLEHLPALSADRNGEVREASARALGRFPSESTGPLLVELLGDRKDNVVLEALRSLDRLDYEEAGPRVGALLEASDLDVAARAASFLRELGDKRATATVVARVLEHFARSDVSARLHDVSRLQTLRARAELQDVLENDASSSVRFEAQRALASLDD